MDLKQLSAYLAKAQEQARLKAAQELYAATLQLRNDLRDKAPVLTGAYRVSWRYTRPTIGSNSISSSVFNRRSYGPAIELGVVPGTDPWGFGGKGTVKLDGRLWSKKAPLGTVNPLITDAYAKKIASRIAEATFEAFI